MYNPSDFNFGMGAGGIAIPSYAPAGASNPVGSYLQASPQTRTPAANPVSGAAGVGGLGFNMDTGKLVLGGLQTIGSLWQAFEANKLAKEQFKFQKDFANTNLANQIQSYNTTLEDRGRARAFTEGQSADQAQAYLDANRLPQRTI